MPLQPGYWNRNTICVGLTRENQKTRNSEENTENTACNNQERSKEVTSNHQNHQQSKYTISITSNLKLTHLSCYI